MANLYQLPTKELRDERLRRRISGEPAPKKKADPLSVEKGQTTRYLSRFTVAHDLAYHPHEIRKATMDYQKRGDTEACKEPACRLNIYGDGLCLLHLYELRMKDE